ncbi:MAG TPA: GNAT family N-acetyltransferase [Candidatus Dorea intestinavium]|nr:GNAT family N-acetyltransferase [Candidatus Dorea intestinavium]
MDKLMILPATYDGDLNTIAELAEDIWNEHYTEIIGVEQVNYMINKFQSYEALVDQTVNKGFHYFIIYYDNLVVGYFGVLYHEDHLFLSKFYLLKEARGHGIATKTFEYIKKLSKDNQLSEIRLTCNKYNQNSLAFYHHLGFIKIGSEISDIGNGFVMDDFILSYNL